ncbi:MAG: LptA/OstA family protein [Candidatus Margulisiibacteriota bacterium]
MKNKSIEIISPLGYEEKSKFETKSILWSLDDKNITAKDRIVFERDNITIIAGSMKADTELEKMLLQNSPFAVIRNKGLPDIKVRAKEFEVNARTGYLSAGGAAELVRGELLIKSDEIAFDAKDNILFAKGGARITYKDISAVCLLAQYNIRKDAVSLLKGVSLKRGGNELNGDKIDINLKDDTISIKGRRSRVVIEEDLLSSEAK